MKYRQINCWYVDKYCSDDVFCVMHILSGYFSLFLCLLLSIFFVCILCYSVCLLLCLIILHFLSLSVACILSKHIRFCFLLLHLIAVICFCFCCLYSTPERWAARRWCNERLRHLYECCFR